LDENHGYLGKTRVGGFCILKLEFYIESIYYHPENPIPTVIVIMRNNIDNISPEITIAANREELRKKFNEMFLDSVKTHKTSFMIPLQVYRKSGMMVGDRLDIEISINNEGEISN